MMKNIVYSCYSCSDELRPKFLSLHERQLKKYAKKIGVDYKIKNVKNKWYNPPVFTVYEAYKEFANSKYDNMLYIDWDVIISLESENIFEAYEGVDFAAYNWKSGFTDQHIEIKTIEEYNIHVTQDNLDGKDNILLPMFIENICLHKPEIQFLEWYTNEAISGGVMLFERNTMNKFLEGPVISWSDIYNRIEQKRASESSYDHELLNAGGVLSHFAINYLLYYNDIRITNLNKRWNSNSVTNKMKSDEYFYNFNCGGDEIISGETEFKEKNFASLKYVINNKSSFFENEGEYKQFLSQYDYNTILKAKQL